MKIVFALPGREYSREFLLCWSELLLYCIKNGHEILVSQQHASIVHFARTKCLGGNVLNGPTQKPFQGQIDYDYIMWIDSDIIFTLNDFIKLLESPHDVTAGMYMMSDLKNLAAVKDWDEEFFKKNGSFEFLTPEMIKGAKNFTGERYLEVSYAGMGWMLIKKGVIEDLQYPWFRGDMVTLLNGDKTIIDMCSEDVSFCRSLKESGHKIMLDTEVRVGHQKPMII